MAFIIDFISEYFKRPPLPYGAEERPELENVNGREWKRKNQPDVYWSEYSRDMRQQYEEPLPLPAVLKNMVADYTKKTSDTRINEILPMLESVADSVLSDIESHKRFHSFPIFPLRETDRFEYRPTGGHITRPCQEGSPEYSPSFPQTICLGQSLTREQFFLLEEARDLLLHSKEIDRTQLQLTSESIAKLVDVLLGK